MRAHRQTYRQGRSQIYWRQSHSVHIGARHACMNGQWNAEYKIIYQKMFTWQLQCLSTSKYQFLYDAEWAIGQCRLGVHGTCGLNNPCTVLSVFSRQCWFFEMQFVQRFVLLFYVFIQCSRQSYTNETRKGTNRTTMKYSGLQRYFFCTYLSCYIHQKMPKTTKIWYIKKIRILFYILGLYKVGEVGYYF